MDSGYQALHESAAWVEMPGRGKILVAGDDRARLLHAMTTNHIQRLTPGTGCYAYFLSAQGRILADANIVCLAEAFLLDTEPETREKVFQHLDRYIIADDVALEDQTDTTATIALEGPQAAGILPALAEDYASVDWNGTTVLRVPGGFLLFVPHGEKAGLIARLEAAGAVAATAQEHEIFRIELGRPRYGADLSERFLSQEANQAHALHFSKGCYLGQEIVERVRSRGQVHRLLMQLEWEGTAVPKPGTKLPEGAAVVEITSAAFSPARGKVVALGYVRADKAKPGSEFQAGDLTLHVNRAFSPLPALF
jgi:aminomethyltransferase